MRKITQPKSVFKLKKNPKIWPGKSGAPNPAHAHSLF